MVLPDVRRAGGKRPPRQPEKAVLKLLPSAAFSRPVMHYKVIHPLLKILILRREKGIGTNQLCEAQNIDF